jgi:RNA polymerase sigma factor (sigma-70 family)
LGVVVRRVGMGANPTRVGEAAEPVSFEALFRRERAEMVRLASMIAGSVGVGEEVTQEAFLRLHQRWVEVQNPIGFLRTVVTNLARSEARRVRMQRRKPFLTVTSMGDPEIDETWSAICCLPSRQRAVLALRYYADLPEAEIAAILGCRLGTVKSARHRAIVKLRQELA